MRTSENSKQSSEYQVSVSVSSLPLSLPPFFPTYQVVYPGKNIKTGSFIQIPRLISGIKWEKHVRCDKQTEAEGLLKVQGQSRAHQLPKFKKKAIDI